MAEPYVGEIILVGFNFAPVGWAFCDGRLLPIAEYETLFNLIGTTYGGDGEATFAPARSARTRSHRNGPGSGHCRTISRRDRRRRDDHADDRATAGAYARDRHQHVSRRPRRARTDRETSGRRWGTCTAVEAAGATMPIQQRRAGRGDERRPAGRQRQLTAAPPAESSAHDNMQPFLDDELLHLALRGLPKPDLIAFERTMRRREPVQSRSSRPAARLAWRSWSCSSRRPRSRPPSRSTTRSPRPTTRTTASATRDCSLREAIIAANANCRRRSRSSSAPAMTYTLSLGPFDPAECSCLDRGDLDITGRAHDRRQRIDGRRRRHRSRLRHSGHRPILSPINTLTITRRRGSRVSVARRRSINIRERACGRPEQQHGHRQQHRASSRASATPAAASRSSARSTPQPARPRSPA